jgi:triacylglycerol lipase
MKKVIVLAHGIARFDALWSPLAIFASRFSPRLDHWFDRLHYFRNIKTTLESRGFKTYHTKVPFASSLAERAQSLAVQVFNISRGEKAQVHIIGHSMGGLDARYAIAKLHVGPAVWRLTTIGTPHHGSSYADYGMSQAHGEEIISDLRPFFSIEGLRDITSRACETFNAEVARDEAANRVEYHAFAGAEEYARVFKPLRLSWDIINGREGANDGLVSLKSQLWQPSFTGGTKTIGQHEIEFPLDHFNECGWWDSNEPEKRSTFEDRVKQLYLEIASASPVQHL